MPLITPLCRKSLLYVDVLDHYWLKCEIIFMCIVTLFYLNRISYRFIVLEEVQDHKHLSLSWYQEEQHKKSISLIKNALKSYQHGTVDYRLL